MPRRDRAAAQVIGAIAFGFIIANVTAIVETFDPYETVKKRRLDEVRNFALDRGLSRALQQQVHRHLNYLYNKSSVFDERLLLEQLPSIHRCRIVHAAHREYISSLRCLAQHDIRFVCDIVCLLRPMQLPFKERLGYDGACRGDWARALASARAHSHVRSHLLVPV